MTPKRADREWLFATKWVHVREEDTAAGAVYRPEDSDIPLSRQPRERIEFVRDGSARLLFPGADDRLAERSATWKRSGAELVVQAAAGGAELRVVDASPERLVVRRQGS